MQIEITDRDYWVRICDQVMEICEDFGTKYNEKLLAEEKARVESLSFWQRFKDQLLGYDFEGWYDWGKYPTKHHDLYYQAEKLLSALQTEGTGLVLVDASLLRKFQHLIENQRKKDGQH